MILIMLHEFRAIKT